MQQALRDLKHAFSTTILSKEKSSEERRAQVCKYALYPMTIKDHMHTVRTNSVVNFQSDNFFEYSNDLQLADGHMQSMRCL